MSVSVLIQARMSSRRFPGKVLAPLQGKPIIRHVLTAVEQALPQGQIVVVTSSEQSDDPLVSYLNTLDVSVFRGPLENVFKRFRLCLSRYPCEWFLRVNADSPLLNVRLLRAIIAYAGKVECDLVTTIFPRTFPKGQNVELIRTSSFMVIDESTLSSDEREHVTPYFYRNPERFRIVNIDSGNSGLAELGLAVDTVDDLLRLEQFYPQDVHALLGQTVCWGGS